MSYHKVEDFVALKIKNARYFTARQNGDSWTEENKEGA